jgi:YD repeat-containing protein
MKLKQNFHLILLLLAFFSSSAFSDPPVDWYYFSDNNTNVTYRDPVFYRPTRDALCAEFPQYGMDLQKYGWIQTSGVWYPPRGYCQVGYRTPDGRSGTIEWGFAYSVSWCADNTAPQTSQPYEQQCSPALGSISRYPGTETPVNQLADTGCRVGNPCYVASGIKEASDIDSLSGGAYSMPLRRIYRSSYLVSPAHGFGALWMHEWQRRLDLSAYPTIAALRADGSYTKFSLVNGVWVGQDRTYDQLSPLVDAGGIIRGWRYWDRHTDQTDEYSRDGRLLQVLDRNGAVASLTYSNASTPKSVAPSQNFLLQIRNALGKILSFAYDARGRIVSATLPDGATVGYSYDGIGMLNTVTYPDGTKRQYHYENAQFRWALTGITDEKGVRFATYAYDSVGRATSTEHAGGVDKFQLNFLGNGQTSVTTADGTSRTFTSELQGNVLRATGASASCPACGDIAKSVTYDAAGNVASRRDFADKETRYSYDALGRETQRIDGYGTADAKTTTTEWHPTWNLPVRVTRPGQINNFSYGTAGQLLSYAWYASDDPNGSKGFQAVPTGGENSTVWVYNSQGLVEKATDTLNGVTMGEWTFSYDSTGQLLSLANDYGRVGNVVSRDAGGRITEAVNTDGQHLLMQYDAMGRLTSRDVDGVVTTYTYNEIGLLTAVQGATNVMFEYDTAHRLTAYLLPEGQTMQATDASNPFLMASSMSSSSTKAVPQEGLWVRVWSTIKRWLGFLIGDANAQAGWQRTPVSPIGPSQSRGLPSGSTHADILEQGTGSRQWPDPGIILATWTTQAIEKGVQAAKEAICGGSEPCPPCVTVTGKIIPVGTIAHRKLDTPSRPQHGIDGPHYNLLKANQAPRNSARPCKCFWQRFGAVRPEDLPPNAIPVEEFVD